MTNALITLLGVAIAIDVVTLAVVGYTLHQSVSNLAALRKLGLTNGRSIVAKALIRRNAIYILIVIALVVLSSIRIWQLVFCDVCAVSTQSSVFGISVLFTIQILVAASAIYDVMERMALIRWYDDNPGAREYEARAVENDVIKDPNDLRP